MFGFRSQTRIPKAIRDQLLDLETRVSRIEIGLKQLQEEEVKTAGRLHKLTGKVYGASKLDDYREKNREIPFGDKEALRARVGLVAASRPVHNDD